MARTKPKSQKGPAPHIAKASPKKRRKGPGPTGSTTLPANDKVKERAKQQHKHVKRTQQNHNGVCHKYAQTGSCRFGSQCRFAHIEGVESTIDSNGPGTVHERAQTSTQTFLDKFFAGHPKFEYNSSASASLEFYRMCNQFGWGKEDERRERAYGNFKDALVQQFNHIYGTNADNLTSWHTLCQLVRISPIPESLVSCREAVKATHVNIVDLVDTKGTGEPVTVFVSEVKLSEYTKATGKFFPRDNVHAGSLLRYLLRRIMDPRPEHVSGPSRKTKSSRRRH